MRRYIYPFLLSMASTCVLADTIDHFMNTANGNEGGPTITNMGAVGKNRSRINQREHCRNIDAF